MKRSRMQFIFAIAAVVVVVNLGVHRVAFKGLGRASGLPEPAMWMPATASFIVYLDLATLLSNATFNGLEQLMEQQQELARLEEFRELTGMDPWRDIHALSFYSQSADDGEQAWGLAVSGAFDVERLITSLEARQKVGQGVYRDTTLHFPSRLNVWPQGGAGSAHALASPDGSTLLLGPAASVRLMLDVGYGFEPSSTIGPLARALNELSAAEFFWVVSGNETSLGERLRAPASRELDIPTLESFTISARVSTDVHINARGAAADAEAADRLASVLRGAATLGAFAQDNPGLRDLMQSLEVLTLDERVEASLELDSRTVREWLRDQRPDNDDNDDR